MTNIPAMTPAVQAPCVTRPHTKPQPPPAEPAPPESRGALPETGDETPVAVPIACLLMPGPQWRTAPAPGIWPLKLESAGQPLPVGGKGLPPRIPTLPVELPTTEGGSAHAEPGASLAATALTRIATPPTPTPTQAPAGPEAPPLAPGDVEPAPSRLPGETVGRLAASSQSPTFPVLPAARAEDAGAGMDLDVRHQQPDPVAGYRPAAPGARAGAPPAAPLATLLASAVAATQGDADPRADAAISLATAADAAPPPAVHAAAGPAAPQPAQSLQAAAPAVATTPMHLAETVGSDEWNEAVAQRLSQLAESSHARASIRLNPPQLGPLQVDVRVDGDRAVVSFAVHHDATRDALEQAMPRLRAQLADNGFASVDVGVSRNPHRERTGGGEAYLQSAYLADEDLALAPGPGLSAAPHSRLLDAYA
jgi:hypothetical protein